MINVTCFKCGKKFSFDEEAIKEEHKLHYVVNCPFCRQANKVSPQRKRKSKRGKIRRR
jgi:transcription elongation factor Elf1